MTTQADLPDTLADVIANAAPTAPAAPLERAWIAARIPHSGAMCLLDGVQAWDETRIRCTATSHCDPHNPLRSRGRLAAVCGVEYAAQAMAVHGALLGAMEGAAAGRPRAGFLASVRNVVAHVERLDTLAAPLAIEAERMSGSGNTILYGFTVRGEGRVLLTGRAAVMLDASAVIR
ncbi:hotdog family protein [Paraburkholderia silvatlantica]|uniref:Hotdog family 3-hydroxylacyl-ACP dehydratase n=1 Tax=Paraburkholderia silvatlantica TaxID=321895 RepID=A0ABR6FHT3_9BURK|nr:hotdog family protein [Paraburkholderia silvatlantica]MBB2926966.1 putative hotdog family 3-hydroxylacyl-ACP dehydratase [Paraburkholderia silvatlantica]PVY37411.1 putative hotdog family 3-hydroxylacyl-ACP dehydratase [Paraburkholderia silvatlantica]PXW42373.1 putative hotdog family 3-hydroxylacyl-ACP dehydratase [Paraburkholderia silvatlantica]